jgi:hypothetical protein
LLSLLKLSEMRFGDLSKDGMEFNIMDFGNVVRVNPIDFYFSQAANNSIEFDLQFLRTSKQDILNNIKNSNTIVSKVVAQRALSSAQKHVDDIFKRKRPGALLSIFESKDKKSQEKALKNLKIEMDDLIHFFFIAYKELGYVYSFYKFEHLPKPFTHQQLPKVAYLEEDGSITKVGNTSLTDPQIKQILEQRKNTFLRIAEKGQDLHCFFYTMKSLKGLEANHPKHMHYVSNKWNYNRPELLKAFEQRLYPFSGTPHIEIIGN